MLWSRLSWLKPVVLIADTGAPPPVITFFTPGVARPGGIITLHGRGFGAVAAMTSVTLGGTAATIISINDTLITARVPASISPGTMNMAVTVLGEAASGGGSLTVLTITSVDLMVNNVAIRPGGGADPDTIPVGRALYPVKLACDSAISCLWSGDTFTLNYRGFSHNIGREFEEIRIVLAPSGERIAWLGYSSSASHMMGTLTSDRGEETTTATIEMADLPLTPLPDGSFLFEQSGEEMRRYVRKGKWETWGYKNEHGGGGYYWRRSTEVANRQPATASIRLVIR